MNLTAQARFQIRLQNVIFIILLLTISGLIAWLSTRYQLQLDWTMNNRHTLAEASTQILAKLTAPITITAYVGKEGEVRGAIKDLVGRYQRQKPGITLHFVDPFTSPAEVRERNIQEGELLIEYQSRTEPLRQLSEQELSAALQRLARTDKRLIVFLQGHGERNPTGSLEQDISQWSEQLTKTGFEVNSVNFAQAAKLPAATTVLVIASPQTKWLPTEVSLITEYVEQGGNLLWLLDPPGNVQGLEPLAKQLGLTVEPGMIVDPTSRVFRINNPTIVSVATDGYTYHPITAGLENYLTLFPEAVGLKIEAPEGWESTPILKTHPQAWSETSEIEDTVQYNEGHDINGPLDLGVALERETRHDDQQPEESVSKPKQQRVVIMGDSDFLSNALLQYAGNPELAMKMMNWLASEDTFLDLPTKVASDLELQLSSQSSIFLGMIFLLVLPLSLLSTGLLVWLRRRKA